MKSGGKQVGRKLAFPAKRQSTKETIPMKLTWLGHSAFRIEAGAAKLVIDPFLSDNPSWGTKGGAATLQARTRHREGTDEGDCGDGSGCGNGPGKASGAAPAPSGRARRPCYASSG